MGRTLRLSVSRLNGALMNGAAGGDPNIFSHSQIQDRLARLALLDQGQYIRLLR